MRGSGKGAKHSHQRRLAGTRSAYNGHELAGLQLETGAPDALRRFSVRLLELKNQGTPEDRFSFLLGAFIASDLDRLVARGILTSDIQIVISGHGLIAEAWALVFRSMATRAVVLTVEQTEEAFLAGLMRICAQSEVAQLVVPGKSGGLN